MEVKPGYKQTEVGVIPKDWEVQSLGSFCEIAAGRDLVKADYSPTDDGRHPFPIYSNALTNKGLYGFSSSHQYEPDKITVTARGDIGHAIYRSTRFCAIGRLLVLSSKRACDLRFVTEFVNNFVDFALESTGVPQLTAPQISSYAVALPPTKAEQEAIAEVLCDADAIIESLGQLLTKKRHLKQGAMQELLTGKKRLPGFRGEWELRALGEIATANKGSQLSSSEMAKHGRFAHLNGGISPSGYTDESNAPRDTIAISEGGNSCGYVQFMFEPYWCGGHCYSVIPKGVDNRFLYHALKGEEPSIMGLRVGSGLPNVQKTALLAFNLRCPKTSEEQTAIAAILSDMDVEIAALEVKLTKARSIKQAMMQELLTGRIRLV